MRSIRRAYVWTAVLAFTSLLLFAILNVVMYAVPSLRSREGADTPLQAFGLERILPAYPGWSARDLVQLHDESRVVFEYEPIVEFKIKPMSGSYVNVSRDGFRVNRNQAPWPPSADAKNVFVFGGSTAFGWLLSDADTIVSQLQDLADADRCGRPVAFYNFAQPAYISTQESLYFQSLMASGRAATAPDVAIFVDGLNDFFFRGQMAFTKRLREVMDRSNFQDRLGALVDLPMYRMAWRLRAALRSAPVRSAPVRTVDFDEEARVFEGIIDQWIRNRAQTEAVGRQFGVETVFVWQPVLGFKYDRHHHFLEELRPSPTGEPRPGDDIGRAYTLASARREDLEKGRNFLWLADMQEGMRENLYVDRVHYNAKFSREIASRILTFLRDRGPLACDAGGPQGK